MATSAATVLGEGGRLIYHPHREERRTRDDLHAPPAHVLQEGIVEALGHLIRHLLVDGPEFIEDSPEGFRSDLAQGNLRHLGSGSLDLAFELRLPFFGLGQLLLEVGQGPVGILQFALLVSELSEDVIKFPLEGFLLPEQGFPTAGGDVPIGEAAADTVQFHFYPCPSGLEVGDHRPESLDTDRCQSDLLVEPFQFGSPAGYFTFEGAALCRKFPPVLLMAFLLRMGHGDAVSAPEAPLFVDLREEIVECQRPAPELVLVGPAEDLAEGDPAVLCHRYQIGMDMGCPFIEVDNEGQDVLLPELAG